MAINFLWVQDTVDQESARSLLFSSQQIVDFKLTESAATHHIKALIFTIDGKAADRRILESEHAF